MLLFGRTEEQNWKRPSPLRAAARPITACAAVLNGERRIAENLASAEQHHVAVLQR